METVAQIPELKLNELLAQQIKIEKEYCIDRQRQDGIFFTSQPYVLNSVLEKIPNDETIISFHYLEPSCGRGAFLIQLIIRAYLIKPSKELIEKFIQEKLYFIDIDPKMVEATEKNISELFAFLFQTEYCGIFNSFTSDFTRLEDSIGSSGKSLKSIYNRIDFVLGNPPYITLYGRRDKKKSEEQRIFYLNNYDQFPKTLKNGKINYVMLFIEHGLKFLAENGTLSFVIDVSFFETAYMYCRKYLVENYTIESITYNIQEFENVASGQIVLHIKNLIPNENLVSVIDAETKKKAKIQQEKWNTPEDEYKFRFSHCEESKKIIQKIFNKHDPTLKSIYPKKNLRTCVMLLNMEDKFTSEEPKESISSYPYYKGSSGLKYKYSKLIHQKYFNYDKALQDKINDELKEELTQRGIKNKKRIGLGETCIYDNPKVYVRQSAKELIASYDEQPSSANNSLYVFSLRSNSKEAVGFLKYFCGLLNSDLYTFFAQNRRIIRYNKGKQPQIKISDLYQVFIPQDKNLMSKIIKLVDRIHQDPARIETCKKEINQSIYRYYDLNNSEIKIITRSIESFLQ